MTDTILITGCSSGLGRTAARHFAANGWNVIATMRTPDRSLAEEFPDNILVAALDVAVPASIDAAIAMGLARFGRLDAVVNNAGMSFLSVFEATPPDAIRDLFETNLFGPMNVIRAALPHLRESRGAIVNISSGVGIAGIPMLSFYTASKQALEGLSEALAYELETQGIRIRLVEPGAMRTTNFAAHAMAVLERSPVPEGYKPWFGHMLGAMMDYPFAATEEQEVVEAIHAAATDSSTRLRYPVGPDTLEYARLRWTTSEADYAAEMARLTGQAAWRERA